MVTHWNRWLSRVWHRVRQLVAGTRSGEKRLRVAVDELLDHSRLSNEPCFRPEDIHHGNPDDVLRLLHRDTESEADRPRPFRTEGAWPVGGSGPWTVSSLSHTFEHYAAIGNPGYSHVSLGGWTVAVSVDCE